MASSNKPIGLIVSHYLIAAILPYFAFAWLVLTAILFVQQASRYSDIFFNINVPGTLVWQLALALLPNVIAFTCPMAILVGTIIGLTRMQGDSELVAIRASGVGNMQIALPIVLIGLVLSGFAFLINSKGVPLAAGLVRSVALQTAIKKLESPVEPGEFNTDVTGYTIYVEKGDVETGRWQNIFIYSEDRANNAIRLVTSSSGRVDSTDDTSELVLENASVTTLPMTPGQGKYVSESIGDMRFGIKTTRGSMIRRLAGAQLSPEELGLGDLADYAAAADRTPRERTDAELLQQRRILLSITPLIFCLLGTVIVLRLNRGGRGFGIALALAVLMLYYFLAFLGEQLARTHYIPVILAGLLPLAGSAGAFAWFALSNRMSWLSSLEHRLRTWLARYRARPHKVRARDLFVDITTGLRDFDLIRDLLKNYLLTLVFVGVIFLIFTAFEMWKFAGVIDGGVWLLIKYLIYLLPFIYLQLAPSAAMIAILATYVVKSRQNEIVTWTSAGQSVYRLLLPCFVLTVLLGAFNWVFQETVLPRANQLQDTERAQIRNKGLPASTKGATWITSDDRIFSFTYAPDNESTGPVPRAGATASVGTAAASDNEKQRDPSCRYCLSAVSVYEFGTQGKMQSVYRASSAVWRDGRLIFDGPVEHDEIVDGRVVTSAQDDGAVALSTDPLTATRTNPAQLDTSGLRAQLQASESDSDRRTLAVSIQKKYSTALLPFVIALFTAPFSLSVSRKGKAITVGDAVGLWLLFTGASNLFEQLGLNGRLSPATAVWAPLAIFAFLGIFLLTKVRT